MFYTIYKITNLINNKIYIGKHQTLNLDDGYMGSGKALKAAINKYGVECFKKEILHVFDNEADMNAAEKKLVILGEDSYNLCPGGHGGFGYINSNIELRVAKNKKARAIANSNGALEKAKARVAELNQDPQWREWRANLWRKSVYQKYPDGSCFRTFAGKKHTDASKKKIGEANKRLVGAANSQHGTCWVRNESGNKKIRIEDLEKYLELGYIKGRKMHP